MHKFQKLFEPDLNQNKAPKAELKTKIQGCNFTKSIIQFKSLSKSAFQGLSMLQSCVFQIFSPPTYWRTYQNWTFMAEFDFTNMFYQLKIRNKDPRNKDKLAHLATSHSNRPWIISLCQRSSRLTRYKRIPRGINRCSIRRYVVLGDMQYQEI